MSSQAKIDIPKVNNNINQFYCIKRIHSSTITLGILGLSMDILIMDFRPTINKVVLIIQVARIILPTVALATPAQQLQSLIQQSQDRTILLPGVHDALSAKIFQQSGAECMFLSGFGVSASYLGAPDAGILTLNEMEDTARRVISSAGGVPVMVDGDTGYGGCSNMRRAIRGLAKGGAAAISTEDQVDSPCTSCVPGS